MFSLSTKQKPKFLALAALEPDSYFFKPKI
jgi:hypothetical protein